MTIIDEILSARYEWAKKHGVEPTKIYLTRKSQMEVLSNPDIRNNLLYNHFGREPMIFGMLLCDSEHFNWIGD